MTNCPRCHQIISNKAITCPHCGAVLKAYGHPGITLHRAKADEFLCESCTYHADDSCNFPQRPHAKECTLYQDLSQPQLDTSPVYIPRRHLLEALKLWYQRNPALVGFIGLIALSLLITLITQSK